MALPGALGYSVEYNCYAARHSLPVRRLHQGLFLGYNLLLLTTWIPRIGMVTGLATLVLMFIVVSNICDAVNALAHPQPTSQPAQPESMAPVQNGGAETGHVPAGLFGGPEDADLGDGMSRDRAAEKLGLAPTANADEVRSAYGRLFSELKLSHSNAPTPEVAARFGDELSTVQRAAELLSPGVTGDPHADLPSTGRAGSALAQSWTPTTPQPQVRASRPTGFPRSTLVMAGIAILLATISSYLAIQWNKKPKVQVFQPSGPIVQVPAAILFQGSSEAVDKVTPRKVSPDEMVRIQRALYLRPRDPKVLNDAGSVFGSVGQLDQGNRLLAEALKRAPNDPVINYNYARGLYQQGKVPEANQYADNALRLQPRFDEARLLRSAGAIQQRDYNAAEEVLKLVNKGLAIALVTDGVIKMAKGKVQEGLNEFQQALKLAPKNPTALYNSGVASQAWP